MSAASAFLHTTPLEAVSQRLHKSIAVGSKTFQITYPGNADELLDHPSTQSAFHADQYMPYWAELWPSSQMLGEVLMQQTWPADHPALEIGCGVGLAGIVALSLGMHVTFSDYDATAVEFAAGNAIANGFTHFKKLPLDWRFPPDFQVPLLLAADVIYEERNIAPLIAFIQTVLEPEGICLLSDSDRSTKGGFRYALKQANLKFERQPMSTTGHEGREVKGSVYRIYR
ncbi:methyltransferase [cf. Phormidesmis sp. LEGE 11477]|uniref:class I SAM-dependent methyltransferase n=1 Tax=cf. Phormidesmis sp. LEGE 11477 TaxID=1828680 RepID=UPI001882DFD8|nr:methyltransferase [cf. Phormidesmis sp. LEGE 11477]MBE9059952.1 methyltransferase [cf. Phormidesmis sp. LEGE 11477]